MEFDRFGNKILGTDSQGYCIKAPDWYDHNEMIVIGGDRIPIMWCDWTSATNPAIKPSR